MDQTLRMRLKADKKQLLTGREEKGSSCRACAIVHTDRFLINILLVIKEIWAAMGAEMMEQLLLNLPKREITPDHELHRG